MPRTGRPPLYNWPAWFALAAVNPLVLIYGRDFMITAKTMQAQIHGAAKKAGVLVTTRTSGPSVEISVRSRRASYPWDEWFDGQAHILVYGVQFDIPMEDMRRAARKAARSRGLFLRSSVRGDMLRICMSSVPTGKTHDIYEEARIRSISEQAVWDELSDSNTLEPPAVG